MWVPTVAARCHLSAAGQHKTRGVQVKSGAQLNESPHEHEPPALGFSMVKPCLSIWSA